MVRLPGRLVIRESTGPAPRTAAPVEADNAVVDGSGARHNGSAVEEWAPESLWRLAAPLFPPAPARRQGGGRQRAPDRAVLAAILYLTATDRSWRTLPPEMFGVSRATVHRRREEWRRAGLFDRLHRATPDQLADDGRTGWSQLVRDAIEKLAGAPA